MSLNTSPLGEQGWAISPPYDQDGERKGAGGHTNTSFYGRKFGRWPDVSDDPPLAYTPLTCLSVSTKIRHDKVVLWRNGWW